MALSLPVASSVFPFGVQERDEGKHPQDEHRGEGPPDFALDHFRPEMCQEEADRNNPDGRGNRESPP
jgi:hypothetical protein